MQTPKNGRKYYLFSEKSCCFCVAKLSKSFKYRRSAGHSFMRRCEEKTCTF